MSQMITWGKEVCLFVYSQLMCWSPILANHRSTKCEFWLITGAWSVGTYTVLSWKRWNFFNLFFILNSFVTCLVKPFHFHTRSGSELKGGPFALFIPSNIPHPTYHVNWSPIPIHVYEYMGHNIIMVGQSKTLIFSAPWRVVHLGHVYKPN
jgi:hypothetical protein